MKYFLLVSLFFHSLLLARDLIIKKKTPLVQKLRLIQRHRFTDITLKTNEQFVCNSTTRIESIVFSKQDHSLLFNFLPTYVFEHDTLSIETRKYGNVTCSLIFLKDSSCKRIPGLNFSRKIPNQ